MFTNLKNLKAGQWVMLPGVALVSLAVLAVETILNRMFALTFWYHFAFFILSVALFGIGFGGLLVFFTNRFVKKHVTLVLTLLSVILAFSIPLVLMQINSIPLEMNQVATSVQQQKYFRDFFMVLIIPFVLAGYIFSSLFTNYHEQINRIYFADLVGGGIGCFFALAFFPHNGPLVTGVIVSVVVLLAGAFFASRLHILAAVPVLLLVIVDLVVLMPRAASQEVRVSNDKRNVEVLGKKVFADWDNFGYVAVHERTNGALTVTADYSCFTYIYSVWDTNDFSGFKYALSAHWYPFVVRYAPENVGIVGVGAGKDVLLSLAAKATNIYGAEFNSTVHRIFEKEYDKTLGHIARLSNVHIEFEEGRFFVRSSPRLYDVLIFDNSVSQVAVSSGSFTLAESYLFTVEGILDYMARLKPDGVLYISGPWIDAPRFVTMFHEVFKRLGQTKDFPFALYITEEDKNYKKCKILVKNGRFRQAEIDKLANFTWGQKHNILYSPFYDTGTSVEKLVRSQNLRKDIYLSDTELRPSTDDWPFFTQRVKPDQLMFSQGVSAVREYYPQPFLLLAQITRQVALYSFLFLLLPMVFFNIGGLRKLRNKGGSLFYFATLGMAFMLLELVMMQKYTLILGHPLYGFSIVLATLLIAAGLGSFICQRFKNPYQAILAGLGGILVTSLASLLVLRFLSSEIVGWPFAGRASLTILLVGLSGIFMGFMMPSGIRAVSGVKSSIPWLWSINGVFSVVASFIAVYISVLYGFTAVFITALVLYILGTLAFAFRLVLRKAR